MEVIDARVLPLGLNLAIENFHYAIERLELPSSTTLSGLRAAGVRYCNTSWQTIRENVVRKFDIPEEYAAHTCFGAAYIFTLLSDGFHIGLEEKRLVFSNTARGPSGERFKAKWVLGALLVEVIHSKTSSLPLFSPPDSPESTMRYQHIVQSPSGISRQSNNNNNSSSIASLIFPALAIAVLVSLITVILHWSVIWDLINDR
jgi:hypothetical protein